MKISFKIQSIRITVLLFATLAGLNTAWGQSQGSGGSYSVTYSSPSGQWQSTGAGATVTGPYASMAEFWGGATVSGGGEGGSKPGVVAGPGGASCSGQIKATFAWNNGGNPANLPPGSVLIKETCEAAWSGLSGSCTNGLGHPSLATGTFSEGSIGSKWSVVTPGQGGLIEVTCSPSSSGSFSGNPLPEIGHASASVKYKAEVFPSRITYLGTTVSSGVHQLLTGQKVTASISLPIPVQTPPQGTTTPLWSVDGGDPFKAYPWNNQVACKRQELEGTDLANAGLNGKAPSVSFFTNLNGDVQVNFEATLLPPSGDLPQTLAVAVSGGSIQSFRPTVTSWTIRTGRVQIDANNRFGLGPSSNSLEGQAWSDMVISVLPPFTGGLACFAQTITPDRKLHRNIPPGSGRPTYYTVSNNGLEGLDTGFPYRYVLNGYYSWTVNTTGLYGGDSPYMGVSAPDQDGGGTDWYKSEASDTFTTWMMYQPSVKDGQQTTYIPLEKYNWKWHATAMKNLSTGNWYLLPGFFPASGSPAITSPRSMTLLFPEWSRLHPSPQLLPP